MATAEVLYPKDFAPEFVPLVPDSGWGEEFDFALRELEAHGFVVALGVHGDFLDDLSDMAKQEHIIDFCSSDPDRFGDKKKVEEWLQKGRVMVGIYATREGTLDFTDPATFATENLQQVAYSWFGPEKHDPTKITTAYRVGAAGRQLAYERRFSDDDKFKIGLPMGQLVTAVATQIYGAEGKDITLETWASNKANELYDILQFMQTGTKEDVRPTTKPVGTVINGNVVYYDEKRKRNMVKDTRLYKQLTRTATAAAA